MSLGPEPGGRRSSSLQPLEEHCLLLIQALQAELDNALQAGGQRPPSAKAGVQARPEPVPAVVVGFCCIVERAVLYTAAALSHLGAWGPPGG